MTEKNATPLLEARNIVKTFGSLRANDNVNLTIMPGEIHAFLGENGAGKSTLVKMIYGALQPTSGQFFWKGRQVMPTSPSVARHLGIGMVFQHFSLFDSLTVAENIALAMPGPYDIDALSGRVMNVSSAYGLPISPVAMVGDLSVGERQRIEIIRCLLQEPQLLIMDEPTSVLTPQEADQLFAVLRRLASEGCSVLYISHRLEEVKALCDTATILRHGKVVSSVDPRTQTAASLARLMVGGDIHAIKPRLNGATAGKPRLELKHLSLPGDGAFSVSLKDISLTVHAGEIVAVAGVAGNGQGEFFDAVSGERAAASDMVWLDGLALGQATITARRKAGAAFVPEERLGHGAVPTMTLSQNMFLSRHAVDPALVSSGVLKQDGAMAAAERIIAAFDVRKGKADPEARALSGGNLQKYVVGRELELKPKLLVINQPTWGVDAGAAATIRQALIDLAQAGSAVLVISQDLDEIFEIADRIAVISRGQLSAARPAQDMTHEEIGLLMAGAHETAHDAGHGNAAGEAHHAA